MSGEHPIQGLMTTAMENLQEMIEVNTIIGDPVETPDGTIIIPVSKVGFGFAAGGSEFQQGKSAQNSNQSMPFGGGSGGGVSITPVAFLIIQTSGIKMVHLDGNTHLMEKMLDFAPQVVEKIQQLLKGNEKDTDKNKKAPKTKQECKKNENAEQNNNEEQNNNQSENKDNENKKKEKKKGEKSRSIYDI